ncbi:hypothetical protein V1478_005097 [Vespula squamosa]|uniref:Uncharacterized protein n=1 Tax=Vespula squamosa TaxID=30214 RepID=A0ABD2BD73_VESSQ
MLNNEEKEAAKTMIRNSVDLMLSDKTSHIKSTNKMETRSGTGRLNDADLEDIINSTEKKSSSYKNENALFANTKMLYEQWRENSKLLSDAQYASRETNFSI